MGSFLKGMLLKKKRKLNSFTKKQKIKKLLNLKTINLLKTMGLLNIPSMVSKN